jgi:CRP/FNR family cyclic AMP-dependent transcriptional regulator
MPTVNTNDELYGLLMQGRHPRRYSPGEVIFSEGEDGFGVYIVGRGSVELRRGDQVVETVTAPGMFGEMALIEQERRSLTAVAVDDADLFMIPPQQFWVMVQVTPNFARLVMAVMSRRLRSRGATT